MSKEIIVGISTAIGTTLLLYLAGKITQFPTVLVPTSAVVAFHAASCPDGWKEVEFTKGRVIIGVGESADLTSRHLLEKGGEEQHTLTIDEMPKHAHKFNWKGFSDKKQDEYGFGGSEYNIHKDPNSKIENTSEEEGMGKPHNNMPPFVALLFCEKK
jgi:hypothetical protein